MSERKGTKALELWCKRLVKDCPNVHIDNMTTSWRDGIAFCALVHYFKPDLIDVSKLKPEDIYANNQLAYSIAEKYLGIPSLLDPEDMVENEIPDRLSILTYLSQFYQRLGHTVSSPKAVENENQIPSSSGTQLAPFKFGKAGLDKCAACGLPVYLAQRLLVSNKLYHRRCFLCSKCLGHLNPKNFVMVDGSEFTCDSCKNEKNVSKFNNNDQMGMLAFSDDLCPTPNINKNCEPDSLKHIAQVSRPQSILEKINMFERNAATTTSIEKDIANITIKDRSNLVETNSLHSPSGAPPDNNQHVETIIQNVIEDKKTESNHEADEILKVPELEMSETYKYKSDVNKFNFLQTQLINSNDNQDSIKKDLVTDIEFKEDSIKISDEVDKKESKELPHTPLSVPDKGVLDSNVTDDSRLASCYTSFADTSSNTAQNDEPEISISVPPRRKKQGASPNKTKCAVESTNTLKGGSNTELYPDHLNPFSEDEEETETAQTIKKVSSNPFGSSDEEDDVVPPIPTPSKAPPAETTKRLISANPFWSEGEEPSSDEEISDQSASLNKSSIATSTPSLVSSTPRRKKGKAPPPPCILVNEAPAAVEGALPPLSEGPQQATSMDDVASLSSLSSFNSTAHSDQKSFGPLTPMLKKKRLAPTPPDSLSTVSGYGGSMEKGVDTAGDHGKDLKRTKGPAPGLPLPSRRAVRLAVSPEQLQTQLELLETQQLGLERQGVLVERMIRDKCEGDDATEVPQEEVEDLVIQLCELVNEKNDLFRKQTELMYIRRQQRLEQEQADIEHEIRVLQSRPAVNRIDADKAREEQLVSRLVDIVRLRDELVQQIESERRRERQEDIAIATSIANKRAQRNSDSNSSTIKSAEVETTQKKSKVKDKVKKQLKKAKHTLISKKKDEDKEKEKKPK